MPLLWPTLVVLLLILREQSARKERTAALASGNVDALLEPYPSGLFRWHAGAGDDPQVRAEKTPASRGEVLGAIAQAWRGVTGEEPEAMGVLMLSAQADLETGSFAALYNYNLGNLTHVTHDRHPWVTRPEVTAPLRFRAYSSLLDGASDMVRWAAAHKLLDHAARGDLDAYVAGLKAGCYLGCVGQGATDATYTAYYDGIIARARLFQNVQPVAPPPEVPVWAMALGAAVLIAGAWWALGPKLPPGLGERAKQTVRGFSYRIRGKDPPTAAAATAAAVVIDPKSGAATVIAAGVTTQTALTAAILADPKEVLESGELPAPPERALLPPACRCDLPSACSRGTA